MNAKDLRRRWQSADGRALAEGAQRFLLGTAVELPAGIGHHDGRRDLRGLTWASPTAPGAVNAGGISATTLSGTHDVRKARWEALDLSNSRLSGLRFFDSVIAHCSLEGASCRDWRLWNCKVEDSTFARADLRDSALGTWRDGRANSWRNVDFAGSDLRGVLALGCLIEDCSFADARLSGAEFQQATVRRCRFTGTLQDVLFDGREIQDRPEPGIYAKVDFSETVLRDVEFRGCRFDDVKLPHGVYAVPRFPDVARRVLALLEGDESVEARMLRAELKLALKMPGSDMSVGVFNRADYVASGGERLADLAETLLMEAAQA